MAIASSVIISQYPQADGRLRTRERHVTDAGTVVEVEYDAAANADTTAIMTARAAQLWVLIVEEECRLIVQNDLGLVFVDARAADLIAYVRATYRDGEKEDLVPVAQWILNRLADGSITDAQVQNAFNLTAAQWSTLKTKMQNLVAANTTIQSAVGE